MAAEQTKKGGKFLILFSLTELQSKHVRPLATNDLCMSSGTSSTLLSLQKTIRAIAYTRR